MRYLKLENKNTKEVVIYDFLDEFMFSNGWRQVELDKSHTTDIFEFRALQNRFKIEQYGY
jgi:hypothetical protein